MVAAAGVADVRVEDDDRPSLRAFLLESRRVRGGISGLAKPVDNDDVLSTRSSGCAAKGACCAVVVVDDGPGGLKSTQT